MISTCLVCIACATPLVVHAASFDGPPSSQLLSQLHADKATKLKAMVSIAKYGNQASNALPELTKLLKEPDLTVQSHAAAAMLAIDPERIDATGTLVNLLRNKDATVREETAFAAGQIGSDAPPVVKELEIALQGDISPKVRDKAAWAIGRIGPAARGAVPTLIDALKKTHPLQDYHGRGVDGLDENIYKTCIKSLGEIGTEQCCNTLAAMLTDQSKNALQADALRALTKMGASALPAVPALTTQLAEAPAERKIALIKLFKGIGPAAASCLPQLNECMQSKDAVLRRAALDAILAIEGNEKNKQTLLSQALNDSDDEIKQQANSALESANGASRESVKTLMANAETGSPEVRITSIKTLGDYGPLAEEALPMLIKNNLGSAFVPQQRKAAFEAIKRIDPAGKKTIPLLHDNIRDAFKVRAAIELLEYVGSPQCTSLAKALRAQWHM